MARTVTAGPTGAAPVPSFYFGTPPESYPRREQSTLDFVMRTERSTARMMPRTQYPALQAPKLDSSRLSDTLPVTLNRPRKLSVSSVGSNTSSMSGHSLETRTRSSSWSNRTSFESGDGSTYSWRPEYMAQRPSAKPTFRKKMRPNELFSALPGEVLELILDELKKLHLDRGRDSCATCWMRDLCSISLSSRKWSKFARTALYEDVQLVGADSAAHKKRYKLAHGTRIVLLRRTLRANPQIAAIVHSLKVPAQPAGTTREDYHNLVATVVMACPNLERLVGLYPQYNHTFTRLLHAMSTRQRLKQMDWIVEASPFQRQHRFRSSSGNVSTMMQPQPDLLTPGDLQPQQSAAFLEQHLGWGYLTTLSIHCLPGATLTPDTLLTTTLSCLPALQHLYLSCLPVTAFNDNGLQSLPSLKTLSLSHLPGVSSRGLSSFATLSTSQSIRKLTLRHISLDSLPAMARIFSNLVQLETFSLVQSFAPTLPEDTFIWLMPYLASVSLRKLHWDITSPTSCANVADSILARSIGANGFPSLRWLRAPNDPEGIFQSLCRPVERIDLPSDRFTGLGKSSFSSTNHYSAAPASPTKIPGKSSPTASAFPIEGTALVSTDLHKARLEAQNRLETAQRFPRYFVNVINEDGFLVEKYGIAAFIGTAESKINYHLLPDPGARDEAGGLVVVGDMLGDAGEDISKKEGCTGNWNMPSSGSADKKDKERYLHTERGRWRKLELS